jgi:hypothetical protein
MAAAFFLKLAVRAGELALLSWVVVVLAFGMLIMAEFFN